MSLSLISQSSHFSRFRFQHRPRPWRCWLLWATLLGALGESAWLPAQTPETLIPAGAQWRWRKGTNEASNPTTLWRTVSFNDASWPIATAPFHYGESLVTGTLLSDMRSNYTCIFLRRPFVITNASEIATVQLVANCDDGFLAWINGVEVVRDNVTMTAPLYTSVAASAREAEPALIHVVALPPANYLTEGTNLLTVQAFNTSLSGSSDFRFETVLQVTKVNPPVITNIVPAPGSVLGALTQVTVWFSKPVSGLDVQDLVINEQSAAALVGTPGTNRYTFVFTQPPPGLLDVSWNDAPGITDLQGVLFDTGATNATWSYTLVDNIAPQISERTPVAGATVSHLTQVEVLFDEPVLGVEAGALLVNGQPARTVSGAETGPYLFTFAEPAAGLAHLAWAADHGITDLAANAFPGDDWSVTLDPALTPGDVIINEFMAGNLTGLMDEDGDRPDWIELYNRGTNAVNLFGWSLTDDRDVPGQWTFPATILNPGQYLVVFASGKDRRTPVGGNRFHTNFKIELFGEYLGLYNAEYPRVAASEFAPRFPEQRNHYSYGFYGLGEWRYFFTPTPGAANSGSTVTSIAPPPEFSVARGLFEQLFDLTLSSALPGAIIRFTTDGSEPTLANGFTYGLPLTITNTTCLRAAVFAPNYLPSRVQTHSYIYLDSIPTQPNNPPGFPATWGTAANFPGNIVPAYYLMDHDPLRVDPLNSASASDPAKMQRLKNGLRALPVVSLVLHRDDMFGPNGLYPKSTSANKSPNEKACSVELLLPDGSTVFAATAGIDLHGNASRDPFKTPKHGFKLSFKAEYGDTTLQAPGLFPGSPARKFDDLVMRPDFGVSWLHQTDTATEGLGAFQRTRAVRFRDAFVKHSMRDMGQTASYNRFFHLMINGLYWGIYDFTEQPFAQFAENYLTASANGYDIYDQGELKASGGGTSAAYTAMLGVTNLGNNASYETMKQHLDVTSFMDYMLLNFFLGAQDWGNNKNWFAIRPRLAGLAGRFRYVPWDGENTLLNESINRVPNGGGGTDVPSGLFTKLDDNPQFRLDFADRVHKHMIAPDGALTLAANTARWQWWQAHLDDAIVAESCRWGDYRRDVHQYVSGVFTISTRENQWLAENQRVLNSYLPNRHNLVLSQFRTAGLYPSIEAPEFRQNNTDGLLLGSQAVAAGFIVALRNPGAGTIYYTTNGTDPRVYYSGAVAHCALTYSAPITLNATVTLKARVLNGGTWSALNEATFTIGELGRPLRITEIMYNPTGGNAYEFLEIMNVGALPQDLGGFSFQGVNFIFPAGTSLQPGALLVLANSASPAAWATRYPGVLQFGFFGGNLDNGGERLAILDADGRTVIAVHYDDTGGWPAEADGSGYSLEIIDPRGDPNAPANWRASSAVNGTPGLPPVAPPPADVVLNEVMADNATGVSNGGTYPDWVELHNRVASPVDLGQWSLTDSSNPRKFVFPPNTVIPAGGHLVVWCDSETNAPGLHAGFALGRNSETVSLYNANTNRMDALTFGLQLTDYSVGRVAGEWGLNLPTPGAANTAAPLASPTNLTLNEWMTDAPLGGGDWIELFNRSATAPIALRGLGFGTSNAVYRYQALSFVAPLGYLQLFADELPGANHLEFTLPAAGGVIVIYSETASKLEHVHYGPQTEAVSEGRLPDGAEHISSFTSPTPGRSNSPRPIATATLPGGGLVRLMFIVQPGLTYQVQYQTNLSSPGWLPLGDPVPAPTSPLIVDDNLIGQPQRFYRLLLVP